MGAARANPSPSLLLAAVSLLALGCSDESHRLGGSVQNQSGIAPRALCSKGAEQELLDDMEDRDGAIELMERRSGVWFTFNDDSGGEQYPNSDNETFIMSEVDPPRDGSRYAARTNGSGFLNPEFGPGIGFEIYSQKAYDLSGYAGITFWAKRAPDTESTVRFALTDSATTPRGGKCEVLQDPSFAKCSNHFGVDLSLSTEFERYSFTWPELTQEYWGVPRLESITSSEVYGVRFQVPRTSTADFDFWIDDVALLCAPE